MPFSETSRAFDVRPALENGSRDRSAPPFVLLERTRVLSSEEGRLLPSHRRILKPSAKQHGDDAANQGFNSCRSAVWLHYGY